MKEIEDVIKLYKQLDAMESVIKHIYMTDENNMWRFSSYKSLADKYNTIARKLTKFLDKDDRDLFVYFNTDKMKSWANTIPIEQKKLVDTVLTEIVTLKALVETKIDIGYDNILSFKNFIENNMRKAFYKEPHMEKEVQEKFETLLIGKELSKGMDYDRETGRIMYSGKEYIPDFIFPRYDLAIEIKLCKVQYKKNRILDEINADILAYKQRYKNILFVIYDLGHIRDEIEFKKDIEGNSNVLVSIIKH